jgi:magnesium transporter
MMCTDVIALRKDVKVEEAILRIRNLAVKKTPFSYTYVIDEENHLLGVITMRDLILAAPETPIIEFMKTDVFTVNAFMDIEDVASEVTRRKYLAAPVVDIEGKLIGIVKANQFIGQQQQGATEDLLKMFGAGSTESAFTPIRHSLVKRQPWLHVNLLTAFLAAAVVAIFEDTIAQITALAVFLPVVAGQGGNAGNQSLAVVMRGLVMREIPRKKFWKLIAKESTIGLINGITIGIVTAGIAWLWYDNGVLGIVIGLAMIVNLVVAGMSGAAIPLIMKSLGFDPAQSSSIVLTTITDVVGFLAYLGFARMFINYLI